MLWKYESVVIRFQIRWNNKIVWSTDYECDK